MKNKSLNLFQIKLHILALKAIKSLIKVNKMIQVINIKYKMMNKNLQIHIRKRNTNKLKEKMCNKLIHLVTMMMEKYCLGFGY